jgi:dolichol kinase
VLLGIGLVAAAAEAAAPRASDNLAIPAAVWIFLTLLA